MYQESPPVGQGSISDITRGLNLPCTPSPGKLGLEWMRRSSGGGAPHKDVFCDAEKTRWIQEEEKLVS